MFPDDSSTYSEISTRSDLVFIKILLCAWLYSEGLLSILFHVILIFTLKSNIIFIFQIKKQRRLEARECCQNLNSILLEATISHYAKLPDQRNKTECNQCVGYNFIPYICSLLVRCRNHKGFLPIPDGLKK